MSMVPPVHMVTGLCLEPFGVACAVGQSSIMTEWLCWLGASRNRAADALVLAYGLQGVPEKDAYMDLKDKNSHFLFEQDMVSLKKSSNKASDLWVLIFHAQKKRYTALHCQHFEEIDLNVMQDQGVFLQSYLFLNSDIEDELIERGVVIPWYPFLTAPLTCLKSTIK